MLVMIAGGFAAAGDMVLWQVQLAAFAGFVMGDQLTFGIGRTGGSRLVGWAKQYPRLATAFTKAEELLERKGSMAVFLSRTILSPLGPYMGYLSGALEMRWATFTLAAILGAACWSLGYSYLGYIFATQIAQVASLISNALGLILMLVAVAALVWYLARSWRRERESAAE